MLKSTVNLLPEFHHVVVLLYPHYDLKDKFKGSIEFICLYNSGWLSIFSTARKLKAIIHKKRPLFVHSHLFQSNICARLATPSDMPLFNSLHSTYSIDAFAKNRLSILAERFSLKKRHTLIAVSKYVLNDYLNYVPFKGKGHVVYNFLPDSFFIQSIRDKSKKMLNDDRSKKLKCVAIGSLKEAKNYHYILEIWSKLEAKEITLDIYGEGPLKEALQKEINVKKLRVQLCGKAENIGTLLNGYDLFIQASQHEGFGLAVIEAMSGSLPVCISEINVFKEITGGFAHFFPLGNSSRSANILTELCYNIQLRNVFIERAFNYCKQQYSGEIYKQRLLSVYNSVIPNKPGM
jgi:glycosyltransferase involved in cell wall biosynthesis